ncbi:MAG: PPC domain-containing protein [Anaerolineales bacterium]|jgi:hypothetical protein
MKRKTCILIPMILLIIFAMACDLPFGGNGDGDGEGDGSTFTGGECESGTMRLEMNVSVNGSISGGSYPDNCTVYCLWVPDNGSRLEIGISGFDTDLDLYVDTNLSVLEYEDHGQWESNDYGTGDESVSISNPGGRYYIQVCSYEGVPSGFTIESDYR